MLKIEIIENYRMKKKLTKSELAFQLGMLPSNYTMMMKSKSTTFLTLERIAKVLNIKSKELIT